MRLSSDVKDDVVGRPNRVIDAGMIYHVVNRAAERRRIFTEPADYGAFVALLAAAGERFPIDLLAYCVMPNHWHLILQPREGAALSAYMHWLTCRHVSQHRRDRGTTGNGHLYQGRFRSSLVDTEFYYWNVLRYVEANPVRVNLVERAEQWQWGSLFERETSSRTILAPSPISLPANWSDYVNGEIDPVELAEIRASLLRYEPHRPKVDNAV